ncbi:MAG TPA: 3-dehydroquinate synthase [Candidatus Dorea intestinavium]|nr:3-dehydroquinate synthase [Candidatus Dorea intestinavium]
MRIQVNLKDNSYLIKIKNHLLDEMLPYVEEVYQGKKIFIVSDDNVFPLYGEKVSKELSKSYEVFHFVLPHGESTKSFHSLPLLYKALTDKGITRSDLIIALGGGVIGDLAGFVAASYLRGIDFIQIPTSLLAQVDSSVGGKVAVDLPEGKNLVGAFYQPKLVLIDPLVLETLPTRFINDGMGEVIKYGCIKDEQLFRVLKSQKNFADLKQYLPDVIANCIDIKRQVVENDPFDKGERMLLNFGHTLAHGIEQYYHYERESHGEAVAIGMYQITRLAEEKGLSPKGSADSILELLNIYGLPHASGIKLAELLPVIKRDKKNINAALNVILLKQIGSSFIYPTTSDFFNSQSITTI